MKVQRDKKMNVAVRRQVRGGENQRFSPENWAYAQFLTDFSAACRQRERRGRNGKNENAGSDASWKQHGGNEGV